MSTTPDIDALGFRYEVRPEDPATIRRLVAATGFFSAAEVGVAEELIQERLSKGLEAGYEFIFAERCQQTVGYVCFGAIPCTSGSYDLYWIAVDPACQRQGIGALLVGETERTIRQVDGRHIYIETSGRPLYAATRKFYERCGYLRVAELADFYAAGDAKVIYRKALV